MQLLLYFIPLMSFFKQDLICLLPITNTLFILPTPTPATLIPSHNQFTTLSLVPVLDIISLLTALFRVTFDLLSGDAPTKLL